MNHMIRQAALSYGFVRLQPFFRSVYNQKASISLLVPDILQVKLHFRICYLMQFGVLLVPLQKICTSMTSIMCTSSFSCLNFSVLIKVYFSFVVSCKNFFYSFVFFIICSNGPLSKSKLS